MFLDAKRSGHTPLWLERVHIAWRNVEFHIFFSSSVSVLVRYTGYQWLHVNMKKRTVRRERGITIRSNNACCRVYSENAWCCRILTDHSFFFFLFLFYFSFLRSISYIFIFCSFLFLSFLFIFVSHVLTRPTGMAYRYRRARTRTRARTHTQKQTHTHTHTRRNRNKTFLAAHRIFVHILTHVHTEIRVAIVSRCVETRLIRNAIETNSIEHRRESASDRSFWRAYTHVTHGSLTKNQVCVYIYIYMYIYICVCIYI